MKKKVLRFWKGLDVLDRKNPEISSSKWKILKVNGKNVALCRVIILYSSLCIIVSKNFGFYFIFYNLTI